MLLEKMPEGRAALSGRLPDRPARARAGVGDRAREGPAPHARRAAVLDRGRVDQFDEPDRPGGLLRVYCTILVETDSQKPIVIGRAGSMIKQIGTEARQDLETFFACKVYLDLRVKVKPDWRDDERVLDDLGLPRKR